MNVIVNPDADYAKDIRKSLKANGGYCTCQITKSKDTKCMCKEFRDQMERGEEGFCRCGLYNATKED